MIYIIYQYTVKDKIKKLTWKLKYIKWVHYIYFNFSIWLKLLIEFHTVNGEKKLSEIVIKTKIY